MTSPPSRYAPAAVVPCGGRGAGRPRPRATPLEDLLESILQPSRRMTVVYRSAGKARREDGVVARRAEPGDGPAGLRGRATEAITDITDARRPDGRPDSLLPRVQGGGGAKRRPTASRCLAARTKRCTWRRRWRLL